MQRHEVTSIAQEPGNGNTTKMEQALHNALLQSDFWSNTAIIGCCASHQTNPTLVLKCV